MRPRLANGVLATLATILVLGSAVDVRAAAVTIRDPAFDLPHVCADTDVNAAREQGFAAFRDRAGQFLLVMNVARGTLHRAIGTLGVSSSGDIETRRTGYSRLEFKQMYDALPADSRAILLAYAEGVNEALNAMVMQNGTLEPPLEVRFFRQADVAGAANLFGNATELTQGEGADPFYDPPGTPPFLASGFQFTPELSLAFAVLQIREFGFEAWDELGMAEDLEKLIDAHGSPMGDELWADRHWINDPLSPVSVPDIRNPGFGGPLAALPLEKRIELAKAVDRIEDRLHGRTRLPGYPMRDYRKAIQPWLEAKAERERVGRQLGAWPALGSYAWMIAPGRSATTNPWIGGFPQTGIQTPSIMHYSEIRGDTIRGNGMAFVGAPFVLIGHTDTVAFTTTTAHLKVIDTYIEELANGDYNLFKYDHHGTVEDMAVRTEIVGRPSGSPILLPVFRTHKGCSVNGCNGGTRPVVAFSGEFAGAVDSATSTSITDSDAGLTPSALVGGHVAIVNGTGAGQIRAISANTADTITVGVAFATTPDNTSEWVAVPSGEEITAVTFESPIFLGEAEAANGFGQYQRAGDVLDIRAALRSIPSTHNFVAADNVGFNGIGANTGTGNIYYGTSGFHRVRQSGPDDRLPIDGTAPNTYEVVTGTVGSAGASSLTDVGAFIGNTFTAEPINYTYDNPDSNGQEYIVTITAGDGLAQTRRIVSNTDDTLTLEHPWGLLPSAGDTYAVYEIWATPEAMNPMEGFTANWNNKQSRATDAMLGENGRNHRVEMILEQLSLDPQIDRTDLRNLNEFVAGVTDPGKPGRYLLTRLAQAIAFTSDCGTVDDALIAHNGSPEHGREFQNPLLIGPTGEPLATAAASGMPDYIKDWATELAAEIYGDEYDPATVSKLTGDAAIGWILHAIDSAAGDVTGSYSQVYAGDYFNGTDWRQVVRDSFCNYVTANPTIESKDRAMSVYEHPLKDLPCSQGCATPIEFDPTPRGNRGTWEQIVEVGATVTGEFVFPLGQSGHIDGTVAGFTGNNLKQSLHTSTLQPIWRDWRFAPMLHVCEDVTLGGDEDGDTDGDGVVDGFEKWYYAGSLANDATSDTDADGATLATEWARGSDPTVADTDEDTVNDGSDVAPQDRLCVNGTLKKLGIGDKPDAGKDKVTAKWQVPLNVCIGSDYETACTSNTDCGVAGHCMRIRVNPVRDPVRVVASDGTPVLDASIPIDETFWKNKNDLKFSYKDSAGTNSPVGKMKIDLNEKKGVVRISFSAKKFDAVTPVDGTQGVVGLSIGNRCFMEMPANCKSGTGKLSCKD
jgi:hypothetical protein